MSESSRGSPRLLKFLDSFEVRGCRYEAYLLTGGKVMVLDEEGGITFFGDVEEYLRYRERRTKGSTS